MPNILLTTVFKPYGVKDHYAEATGMQMELFNNQITREQSVHSPRSNFWTFPLYFLAENISIPSTVLDFPSWNEFKRELRRGYTHVGFSFIQTNVMKIKRMAEYVRRRHPDMKVILGGYGTALPDIRELVPCDEVCHGEGVGWLRRYFSQDPDAPIKHPVMHGVARKHIYGYSTMIDDSAALFPGLGCTNGCFFCSTSAKFGKRYIPVLPDGESVFNACRAAEADLGVKEFAIVDENFLRCPDRAADLLRKMEEHKKAYKFAIFSSAENLTGVGIDFLVRMGVSLVWIGIESEKSIFGKTRNIDVHALIHNLQAHGISVVSSSILFLEHHDEEHLRRDIEWAIRADADYHQFMQLTPLPGTPLYDRYRKEGKLIERFPYTRMSGQDALMFQHPHFSSEQARHITRDAFSENYRRTGPGVLKMAGTALRGYRKAVDDYRRRMSEGYSWNRHALKYHRNGRAAVDRFMEMRIEMMKSRALEYRPILMAAKLFSPNGRVRNTAVQIISLYEETFGKTPVKEKVQQATLCVLGGFEWIRIAGAKYFLRSELVRQPPTRRIEYRASNTI